MDRTPKLMFKTIKEITMKKKVFSGLIAMLMTLSLGFGVLSADVKFTDVKEKDWFYKDVKIAVEKDLVNGKSDTIYAPYDRLTYAEAVKLAACMHQRQHLGKVTLQNGSPWYQPYVDYCKDKKIIDRKYPWNLDATRAEYMEIFSRALPESELKAINTIKNGAIPDVPESHKFAKEIYKLYRAGIVNGADAERNCKPDANITRAEVAAILTRMMDKNERVKFSMDGKPDKPNKPDPAKPKELKITKQPANVSAKPNEKVTFKIEAVGDEVKYQWQVFDGTKFVDLADGTKVTGAKQAEISLFVPADAKGDIKGRCVVSDKYGKQVISKEAIVKLQLENSKLKITKDLDDTPIKKKAGETVSFEIEAEGEGLQYKWVVLNRSFDEITANLNVKGNGSNKIEFELPSDLNNAVFTKCTVKDKDGAFVESKQATVEIEVYVKNIRFITAKSWDELDALSDAERKKGNAMVDNTDFNQGTDGDLIAMVCEGTGNPDEAIKDIFLEVLDVENDSYGYFKRNHYGESNWYKDATDLNKGAGGKYLYLFWTWENGPNRRPVTDLHVFSYAYEHSADEFDSEVIRYRNSSEPADFNKGAGGEFVYLLMDRAW